MSQARQVLYRHVYDDLKRKLQTGVYQAGMQLPSERQLSKNYDVSRMTIREALEMLASEHFIRREQGRGSFVLGHPYERSLNHITTFVEDIERNHDIPTIDVLRTERIKPDEQLQHKMNILAFDDMYEIERLIMANGRPVVYETWYVAATVDTTVDQQHLGKAFYTWLNQDAHVPHTHILQTLSPRKLNKAQAVTMRAHEQDSCMLIETFVHNDMQIVAYGHHVVTGHDFTYHVTLK